MLTRPDSHINHGVPDTESVRFHDLALARIVAGLVNSIRLIAGAAFAAGMLAALAWYALLEPAYQSEAYVAMNPDSTGRQKAMFYSPAVLDPVVAREFDTTATRDRARAVLRRKLTVEPARGEDRRSPSVFVVRVEDTDPRKARTIAAEILDGFIESTRPGAMEQQRLETEMARARQQRDEIDRLVSRLDTEAVTLVSTHSDTGELATPLAQLVADRAKLDAEIVALEQRLAGMTADAILSSPTIPDRASRPIPWFAAVAAGLLLGFLAAAAFVAARLVLPAWLAQVAAETSNA